MLETKETHKARVKEQKEMMRKTKMKQNKQKALERLREIEEEGNLVLDKYLGDFIDYKVHKIMFNLQKEAQKIKDNWVDDCGKEFILGTEVNSKGEFKRDIKEICGNCDEDYEIMFLCSTCKAQNKEKDEICGRILG